MHYIKVTHAVLKETNHMEKKEKKIDTKAMKIVSAKVYQVPNSMASWKKWQAKKEKFLHAHTKMVDRKFRIARRWMEAN